MARTAKPRIVSWGTPPAPEPEGWPAVAAALREKPGKWANVGMYPRTTADRVRKVNLPAAEGFEVRLAPTMDDNVKEIWASFTGVPEPATS